MNTITHISVTLDSCYRRPAGFAARWKTLANSAEDRRNLIAAVEMLQTRTVFPFDVITRAPSSYLRLTMTAYDRIIAAGVYETKAGENHRTCVVDGAGVGRPAAERCQAVHFAREVVSALHPFSAVLADLYVGMILSRFIDVLCIGVTLFTYINNHTGTMSITTQQPL